MTVYDVALIVLLPLGFIIATMILRRRYSR